MSEKGSGMRKMFQLYESFGGLVLSLCFVSMMWPFYVLSTVVAKTMHTLLKRPVVVVAEVAHLCQDGLQS